MIYCRSSSVPGVLLRKGGVEGCCSRRSSTACHTTTENVRTKTQPAEFLSMRGLSPLHLIPSGGRTKTQPAEFLSMRGLSPLHLIPSGGIKAGRHILPNVESSEWLSLRFRRSWTLYTIICIIRVPGNKLSCPYVAKKQHAHTKIARLCASMRVSSPPPRSMGVDIKSPGAECLHTERYTNRPVHPGTITQSDSQTYILRPWVNARTTYRSPHKVKTRPNTP